MQPLLAALLLVPAQTPDVDLRDHYDVRRYDLVFAADPATETLDGSVGVHATVRAASLDVLRLDLVASLEVLGVATPEGAPLKHLRSGDLLDVALPAPVAAGGAVDVVVRYRGQPKGRGFSGFHWDRTPSDAPWISTSCQGPGAHSWWPCKASFFNPDDKPDEGTRTRLVVPEGLYGVSNGRLVGVTDGVPAELDGFAPAEGSAWRTYEWRHPYPLETYAVTLNVAPYVVVERELALPDLERPVPFVYYVLPEDVEKAALQFADVPPLLEAFSRAFGPWPFPDSKVALVETRFWGMEHSTAVAYGSSFPAWCAANGQPDRFAARNRFFDYILVHETAHEWWGNAVSAADWGDFWIHEGFGTYAEAVYLELTQDRTRADEHLASILAPALDPEGRVHRGDDPTSGAAYSALIYYKGAWVLQTLRTFVDDDDTWWRVLRAFNVEHRYGCARTADFRRVLERETGRDWGRFFQEWFYGAGAPELTGTVAWRDGAVRVDVVVQGEFHLPLDVEWTDAAGVRRERVDLAPGANTAAFPCRARPTSLSLPNRGRVLCKDSLTLD